MLYAPGELYDELARAHEYRWTHTEELLALLLQKVDELVIITGRVWSDPKKLPSKIPTAFRYPRPGPVRKRKTSPIAEIRRFFTE